MIVSIYISPNLTDEKLEKNKNLQTEADDTEYVLICEIGTYTPNLTYTTEKNKENIK